MLEFPIFDRILETRSASPPAKADFALTSHDGLVAMVMFDSKENDNYLLRLNNYDQTSIMTIGVSESNVRPRNMYQEVHGTHYVMGLLSGLKSHDLESRRTGLYY